MNDLMRINDKTENDYDRYEELLLKRDHILKESESILIAYTREFGELMQTVFMRKIECIRLKKLIAYCQKQINRGLKIDMDEASDSVDTEMVTYYIDLMDMIERNEDAKNAQSVDELRYLRSKRIYRRLAKKLHPDINARTERDEELSMLWNRIVSAYQASDDNELENLEVLARKMLNELGDEGFEIVLDNIAERIVKLERTIGELITSEPYVYKDLLLDEDKVKEKKDKLNAELDEYTKYLAELTDIHEDMISKEGVSITWKIN
ncbi:MAG: hypothetical protein K6F34_03715 [Lachnospiraceae bacterium]|nr:hypothetical protein [Lachnospiraceae bacterium]